MNIIFLGSTGVGKGTYSQFISKHYKIPHLSSGDLLRKEIEDGTELGKKAEILNKGNLAPTEVVNKIIYKKISKCERGFILEGYPRTLTQAKLIYEKVKIDVVISFKAPEKVILDRLSGRLTCSRCGAIYHTENIIPKKKGICDRCGGKIIIRDDDKPAAIKKKLRVYKEDVGPVIRYYKKKGILHEIDATADINTPGGKKIIRNTIKAIDSIK